MRAMLVLAFVSLVLSGCASPPHSVTAPVAGTDRTWVGAWSGALTGDAVVSVHVSGSAVSGLLVVDLPDAHSLTGSLAGDSIVLAIGNGVVGTLRGEIRGANDDTLSAHVLTDAGASDLVARRVPESAATEAATTVLPFETYDLAYDGTHLWHASSEDHIRTTLDGTIVDTVSVFVRDAHWIANVAAWDGTRMWGVYPYAIYTPGGTLNAALLLGYDAHGRTGDSVYVAHRPVGLAWDGASLWSLRFAPPALIRLDASGAPVESLHVELPDATKLAWDGTHFWTVSWFLKRLCRLDASGHVDALYTLPASEVMGPSGLVRVGSEFVYAETGFGAHTSRTHRLTIP